MAVSVVHGRSYTSSGINVIQECSSATCDTISTFVVTRAVKSLPVKDGMGQPSPSTTKLGSTTLSQQSTESLGVLAGGSQERVRSQASSSSLGLQYRTWAETTMGQVMRRLWSLTYK